MGTGPAQPSLKELSLSNWTRFKTLGGVQKLNLVSESGLYKLIMRSDKPIARPFQDWVTRVVLPAIRKKREASHGSSQGALVC